MPSLELPESRAAIAEIQRVRKRVAFDRARTITWYAGKLDHIDPDRLDDPAVWSQIPILDKDVLRRFDHAGFLEQFCCAAPSDIAEYWRSGGSTGKPVFYPRTHEDMYYALQSWGRAFPCMGIGPEDLCHIAFPLGVHPAGQVLARSAALSGVGMVWVGAGNVCPSETQLALIQSMRPTVFLGMSSFALNLANLAEASGIDLAASSVSKIVCSAEVLSAAKREKLTRMWGADVYDVFGMSEAGLMGAETAAHDGLHIWTDLYHIEVVDIETGQEVPEGEIGTLCVTPLWTNHATPFLRWNSGDLVRRIERAAGSGPFAELFPVIHHANRTTGFFKIRGVNVNHAEFEDMMFRQQAVSDFQAVLFTSERGLEEMKILAEVKAGADPVAIGAQVTAEVKRVFEVATRVEILPQGTLAALFEKSLKAQRFHDERV
jgi:phenylacetate-CoA ligase